ncbi:uncharacterized protein CLUP02_13744 [Colletotrichum lupini]|uniref:Uncharacterized protein n=1 Tax=Colletotrichum lupini TaxID=145971 RepID=A0A9Q8WM13_9PEZI|nr:uncharacterized protein CLUP02_13744 [Colletotrichum lupini]UQC88221.1 hypothetical protein CLUP02_13744 [Colletotrichum lupini]
MEGRSGKVKESVGLDRACGHGPDDICTLSVPVTNRMSSAPSVDEAYAEGRIRRRRTADVLAVKLALWAVDPDGSRWILRAARRSHARQASIPFFANCLR